MAQHRPMADSLTDEQTIHALRRAYGEAIAARRAGHLVRFLDPDLTIIASTGAVRIGREAVIANHAANEFRDPAFVAYERIPDTIEIAPDGMAAVERGHWRARFRQDDGSIDGASGLYQAGWVRKESSWLIRSEAYVRLALSDGPITKVADSD